MKIIVYFNYETRFNGVFSKDNLPKIKNGAHAVNLDDKKKMLRNTLSFIIYWPKHICILLFFWNWIYFARSIKQNQQ